MSNMGYLPSLSDKSPKTTKHRLIVYGVVALLIVGLGVTAYMFFSPSGLERAVNQLQFDDSLTENERQTVQAAIRNQAKTYRGTIQASSITGLNMDKNNSTLMAYVPVTNVYSPKQRVSKAELKATTLYVPADTDQKVRSAIASALRLKTADLASLTGKLETIAANEIAFIPANQLSSKVKLLNFNNAYYLDSFRSGAVFRQVVFTGDDAAALDNLKLNSLASKDTTLKVNMTGVTALTREMMRKLNVVKDPLYFSAKIGDFLGEADITHVSNEVSFQAGCQYSHTSFCSPPEFIETLKDSGVDLVELTGNHNNDKGSLYNANSIKLYKRLGMATFGGGLNSVEAAKPYTTDQKGSKITFIGYNLADGANSGAIAGISRAGANIYTDAKAKADIRKAKQGSQFVIVNIQYAECQAYPNGYVEYPVCDGPIGGQQTAFRKLIDFGADMVVGSSAHQPQTYELYKGKPIYYGLGNLYFDQTYWPGTERGIILTHYFADNVLIQTKLSPTVYDKALQTRLMDNDKALELLKRFNAAR